MLLSRRRPREPGRLVSFHLHWMESRVDTPVIRLCEKHVKRGRVQRKRPV